MRGRVFGPLAVAIALSAMTAGGIVISQQGGGGGPAPAGTANIWIESGAGTCTGGRSATAIVYSASASPDRRCGSFDLAWDAMNAGDTARIVAGTYGQQVVTGDKTSTTNIIGEDGVTLAGSIPVTCSYREGLLCASADWMTVQNITIDTASSHGQSTASEINAHDVTWLDVDVIGQTPSILAENGANWTWRGGQFGCDGCSIERETCPGSNNDGEPIWLGDNGHTIDGITIYPQLSNNTLTCPESTNGFHLENIRMQGTNNITIKNVWFKDGSEAGSGHIFTAPGTSLNLTLINNIFGEIADGCCGMQSYPTTCNWTFMYNTFHDPLILSCDDSASNWVGNLGVYQGCAGSHIKNLWQNPTSPSCGTDTFVTGPSEEVGNLGINADGAHLNAGSPAINAGELTNCTNILTVNSRDFEATVRPQSTVCDAGADER